MVIHVMVVNLLYRNFIKQQNPGSETGQQYR